MLSPLKSHTGFLFCLKLILQSQTSYKDHVYLLDTDLQLEIPSLKYSSAVQIEFDPLKMKPHVYVVDLEKVQLDQAIETFRNITMLNPKAKFILMIEKLESGIVEYLAKLLVSRALFVNPVWGNMSTFNPFKKGSLHDLDTEIVHVGNCTAQTSANELSFLDNRVPVFSAGTLFKACYLYEPGYSNGPDREQVGINLEIFNLLLERIGFEPKWHQTVYPVDGDFLNYRMKYLKTSEMCDLHVNLYLRLNTDYISTFLFDELHFFVPAPLKLPRWKLLLKPITFEIWCYWITTCTILSFSWIFIYLMMRRRFDLVKFLMIFVVNFAYFIELSYDITRRNAATEIIFVLIFLQAFLINMIFKCNFNVVLTGLSYEEPIRNLKDIIDNNITFGVFSLEEVDLIIHHDIGEKDYIYDHYQFCDNSYDCLNESVHHRNIAVQNTLRFFKYYQKNFLDENGFPLMVRLDRPLQKIGLTALLPVGHPLRTVIEKYMAHLIDHGFINFILSKYDNERVFNLPYSEQVSQLTVKFILAPMFVLLGGILAGIFAFIMEIYIRKKRNLNR